MHILGLIGISWVVLLSSLLPSVWAVDVAYLTKADKDRLAELFANSLSQQDLAGIHYSVLGYKLLKLSIPNQQGICKVLSDSISKESVDTYYYISVTWKAALCPGTLQTAPLTKYLKTQLEKDGSTSSELYYSLLGLKALGQQITTSAKVAKSLQAALKKDDSISSLAYGLHVAADLGSIDGGFMYDRIEDVVVQADEVDGKYFQFEGGLSITSLVVSGVYKLSAVVNKPPPITADQAVKFGNYFIARKSVQIPKGAWSLLNVLTVLTSNKFQKPVVVSLEGIDANKMIVKVTDLLGEAISGSPLPVSLDLLSKASTGAAVATKTNFEHVSSDKTLYSVKLPANTPPGFYKATVSVNAPDSTLIGGKSNLLKIKITGTLAVLDPFLITAVDSDNFLQPKFKKVEYPGKLGEVLQVDSLQRLAIRFNLKDKDTKKPATVHQAFIRLSHSGTGQELIFVAEEDSNNLFKLDLDIGAKAAEFGHLSGVYNIELIAGGSIYSNSIQWVVAQAKLTFAGEPKVKTDHHSLYSLKPEIKHVFREPEKRPPVFVSNLFTGLILLPLLILFILWFQLGINVSNFSFRLSTLGFHLGLGSIFYLFGMFWLRLNMFETLKYLLILGLITFISGNKLLASIAAKHKS